MLNPIGLATRSANCGPAELALRRARGRNSLCAYVKAREQRELLCIGSFAHNDCEVRSSRPNGTADSQTVGLAGITVATGRRWQKMEPRPLRLHHTKIPTDLPRQVILDLPVARNRAAPAQRRILPPGVPPTLPQQGTAVRRQVPEQVAALHTAIVSSS